MFDSASLHPAPRRELQLLGLAGAFVVAAAIALSVVPAARVGTWRVGTSPGVLLIALVWVACAATATFVTRRALPRHDPYLLPTVYLLSGWGLILIARLTPTFGMRQAAWLVVATAAMLGIVLLPGDLRWLRRYRYTWLLAGLVLTGLTLVLGVNPSGAGERLWLGCCGLYLQPAEVLKLLLVVFLASYLADRREMLFDTLPHLAFPLPGRRQKLVFFMPMLLMWGFSAIILVSQRDLGMSTLFFAVFVVMLYLATGRMVYVVIGLGLLGIAAVLGYYLFDVVRLRVEAWWNPWADPGGRSYQIVQSLVAIAAGGLFGRGLGLGAPGLVPVAHSDFIFAAVAEEWGLAGVMAAIGLVGLLVQRGLRIAAQATGAFGPLLAGGLAATLGLQALLIMGGVVKLIPLTGLALPFLSYGGSSLVTNFALIALMLRLSASAEVARSGRS